MWIEFFQKYILFTSIEMLFILLTYFMFNGFKEKPLKVIGHIIMLDVLGYISSIFFGKSMWRFAFLIPVISIYLNSIYYVFISKRWLKGLLYVFIPFCILLVTETLLCGLVYSALCHIDLSKMPFGILKFIYFIPVRAVEFGILLYLYKKRR